MAWSARSAPWLRASFGYPDLSRPGLCARFRRCLRTLAAIALAGTLGLGLPCGAGAAGEALEGILARLEAMAGHQPSRAQVELASLDEEHIALDPKDRLRIELIRLVIADGQSRADDALALADQLLAQPQIRDDSVLAAKVEHFRFDSYYQLDQGERAEQAVELELDRARRSKVDDALSQALIDRARLLMKRGDYEQACAAITDAERHAQGAQITAEVRFSNAILAKTIGDWTLALQSYRDAYDKFHAVEDRTGEADSQAGAGLALNELGRAAEAVGPLTEAIGLYRQVGDQEGAAIAKGELALSQAHLGQVTEALATNAEGIEELSRVHSDVRMAQLQVERARLQLTLKHPVEAQSLLERARATVMGTDELKLRAKLHETSADVQAALGHADAAYQESQRGLEDQRRRTEQLVTRQLAAQRGRLESELLTRENALLRNEADASQGALLAAHRAARLQGIATGLAVLVIVGTVVALRRQHVLMRRIARMAETDPLTGVSNRRHVIELGQRLMNRCNQGGRPYALLLLDLDRFKDINDGFGHGAGDVALCSVSQTLRRHLRPDDQLGRYGGEEFAVILPGADAAEASAVAERLRAAVAALPPDWAPGAPPLTLSGGIAIARPDHSDFSQLLVRADKALYRAKNAGRNRIEIDAD
jgi:diguanylate cyclase (GGDEF)-like protein